MCFFKDKKQQHIQLAQVHDDQAAPQMSDDSFHDTHEEYMPFDDDFVHNYMIHACTKPVSSLKSAKTADSSKLDTM